MVKIPCIAVITLSWNYKGDTLETIKGFFSANTVGLNLEIIVVDNNSTGGAVKELEKLGRKIGIRDFYLGRWGKESWR